MGNLILGNLLFSSLAIFPGLKNVGEKNKNGNIIFG
jgi:hypothetical protein